MAEAREQIYPKVAITTKALLLRYCQEKHTTQGDVVDAALLAFLQPKAGDDLEMVQMERLRSMEHAQQGLEDMLGIMHEKHDAQAQFLQEKLEALEAGVVALVPLLTTIVEKLETPPEPQEAPVPIADYDQLYKELRPGGASAEADADAVGTSDESILPETPAAVAPEVSAPPPERRGWFFARRAAP
jgi:hypothetical protein